MNGVKVDLRGEVLIVEANVGDTVTIPCTVTDKTAGGVGTPWNWTGATVAAPLYRGDTVATNLTTATATGQLTLTLPAATSTSLGAGTYRGFVTITKGGNPITWLRFHLVLKRPEQP